MLSQEQLIEYTKGIKPSDTKLFDAYNGGADKFALTSPLLAKVVDVYDGDTCTVIISILDQMQEFKVRLLRINSEEIRQPKNRENRITLKARALVEKQTLSDQVLGKLVLLDTVGFDSFGRILAEVYTLDRNNKKITLGGNVNNIMLESGTKEFVQ